MVKNWTIQLITQSGEILAPNLPPGLKARESSGVPLLQEGHIQEIVYIPKLYTNSTTQLTCSKRIRYEKTKLLMCGSELTIFKQISGLSQLCIH